MMSASVHVAGSQKHGHTRFDANTIFFFKACSVAMSASCRRTSPRATSMRPSSLENPMPSVFAPLLRAAASSRFW